MRIVQATPGTKACDTFSRVTTNAAHMLRADGFEAIGLYIALVSPIDIAACHAAGLGVFFFLEGLAATTVPSADVGMREAVAANAKLSALSIPIGATLFSDLEGEGHEPDQWAFYANAVHRGGRMGDVGGAYIGAGIGLTSRELFALSATRYMHGGSQVKDRNDQFAEPTCGWCAHQGFPLDIPHRSGLKIDVSALWHDYAGRGVSLVVP